MGLYMWFGTFLQGIVNVQRFSEVVMDLLLKRKFFLCTIFSRFVR